MTNAATPSYSWQRQLEVFDLPADSYTAQRLQHATPEHLHRTTRRCFIGPMPQGWLKSHRRDWYKDHLHVNYSRRAATFSTTASRNRRLSGLEGPSVTATFGHSFPQPDDILFEEDEEGEGGERGNDEDGPSNEDGTRDAPPQPPTPKTRAGKEPEHSVLTVEEASMAREPGKPDGSAADEASPSLSAPQKSPVSPKLIVRRPSGTSFATAAEGELTPLSPQPTRGENKAKAARDTPEPSDNIYPHNQRLSLVDSTRGPASTTNGAPSMPSGSTASLLQDDSKSQDEDNEEPGKISSAVSRVVTRLKTPNGAEPERRRSTLKGLVQFDLPEGSKRAELQARAQLKLQRASSKLRRGRLKDGLIVKMERMLVRVDITTSQLSDEYDECDSQGIESRTTEKWREYMVVCRQTTRDEADYTLQMYKTRVIPAIEASSSRKKSKHEILLGRKIAKVNLYSALDKTVVIWVPEGKRTTIYIIQARSSSNAVEWYTFLRNILGWSRAAEVQVNVPDMSASLRLENPFEGLEASRDVAQAAEGDDEALIRTMKEEQAVAAKLIDGCVKKLAKMPEWSEIMKLWSSERIGLCWKRYDRLEWIHGANERKMYGTIAMMKSHELELRLKEHYPTKVHDHKHHLLEEPPAVEGFLVRLTSQKGGTRRLGLMFFKRLYFATFNQYLVFSRPAKASPPPPPSLPTTSTDDVPGTEQIAENIPLIYTVNPYPVRGGEISWLTLGNSGTSENRRVKDLIASEEEKRKSKILLECDGYINLCDVNKVRKMKKGASPADDAVDDGSDVDFDEDVADTNRDDGATRQVDEERTFELLMKNGLVIRLQAFDNLTKREWMKKLRELVKYWKHRTAADVVLLKSVRQQNLQELKVDEEAEAYLGQFARKWEVTHSIASSTLYNFCGVAGCRTIHMSGILYRKPRRHATFTKCSVILSSGRLLIFQDAIRTSSGKLVPHIHHERISALDLRDCYLYSGLLTESELLYQNRTFDSNKPGHHALPRLYREDGWTSTDEDVMCCFVIWHGKSRSWFRSEDDSGRGGEQGAHNGKGSRLKLVSQLGVPGRSVMFRARSRAERDHWVLAIQTEIERSMQEEDFRITETEVKGGQNSTS